MDSKTRNLIASLVQTLEHVKTHFKHQHVINRQTSELMTLEIEDVLKDARRELSQ